MLHFIKKFRVIIIISIVAIVGILYYSSHRAATQSSLTAIKPYSVKKMDLKQTLTLSGKIDAEEKATVRFATSGKLAWIGVKEGDVVTQNQTMATLDQRDLKKTLQKKLNSYLSSRWDFEQSKDDELHTSTTGVTTDIREAAQRIMDKSQFDLNNAVLDVELQALTIEYSSIQSPINGIVTKVDIPYTGINITPASAEFEVINPNTVFLSVLADQNEVVGMREGLKASIIMDSYPDESIESSITSVSFIPKTGETGTVYELKVPLPITNIDRKYKIGMTSDVVFVKKEKHQILAIPTSYIKTESEKKYVWKNISGKKVKTYITPGEEFDTETEILKGLKAGDIIYDRT